MLEIEQLLVQHCLREAFSEDEIKDAKAQQEHISVYQKVRQSIVRNVAL